jgi:YgiT-type zinc finger domain-containing protein
MKDGMARACDLCGKKATSTRRVTRSFGHDKQAFLIEEVPVISCSACGESYMTAETLKEIERIRLHRKHVGVSRSVLVTRFGGAECDDMRPQYDFSKGVRGKYAKRNAGGANARRLDKR